jgi:hypothetical protein
VLVNVFIKLFGLEIICGIKYANGILNIEKVCKHSMCIKIKKKQAHLTTEVITDNNTV